MEAKDALKLSLKALTRMGAKIGNYNTNKGVIDARTRMSWRSFGEIISVRATGKNKNEVKLRIDSDAIQPSVLFDLGANARNIRRFKEELLQSKK